MADAAIGVDGFGDSMSGQQIYDNFMQAPGPGGLQVMQDALSKVMSKYNDRAQQITQLAGAMEEGWTGDAADAAQRSAGPLAVAHDDAAMQMAHAARLIDNQSQAFYDTKNKVVQVPDVPKAPSTWDQVVTLGTANAIHEVKVQAAQVAAQRNVEAMNTWTSASSDNGSRMPATYGNLDPGALNVTMVSPSSPPPVIGGGRIADPGAKLGSGQGGTRSAVTSGSPAPVPAGGGYQAPTGQTPITTGSRTGSDPTQYTSPGGYTGPGGTGSGGGSTGTGWTPGGSTTGDVGTGWSPVGAISGSLDADGSTSGYRGGSGSPSNGAGSGGSDSATGGRAASRLHGGGTDGEKGLSPGKRVGAGAGTTNEPAARGGSAGATGKTGVSGMGAGAGGGKGKGGEDEEHQRKYVLADDEPFQLTEEGERLIDPNTGLPVAPPVIGA